MLHALLLHSVTYRKQIMWWLIIVFTTFSLLSKKTFSLLFWKDKRRKKKDPMVLITSINARQIRLPVPGVQKRVPALITNQARQLNWSSGLQPNKVHANHKQRSVQAAAPQDSIQNRSVSSARVSPCLIWVTNKGCELVLSERIPSQEQTNDSWSNISVS
jgi:hypothetical protein